jgi:hypothetical protein
MSSKSILGRISAIALFLFLLSHLSAAQNEQSARQSVLPQHKKAYQLKSWKNMSCRAKGRFQDQMYCSSKVIDRIVSDGKAAIPILISQITDDRWIDEPVYDFWPQIRAGELAVFILNDLFLDDTWKHRTMPDLFIDDKCDEASPICWERFRKLHSLADIKKHWTDFWLANKNSIYWDNKSRCFRLTSTNNRG